MEITEDVIMADPEHSLAIVGRLSDAGVQVALDDFGTGYSSLAYLKHLPVDELKIDRSFVASMTTDTADAAIVQTTIDLGRRLGIAVVAEGVENAASLENLATMGASSAQGFHISRPCRPTSCCRDSRAAPCVCLPASHWRYRLRRAEPSLLGQHPDE